MEKCSGMSISPVKRLILETMWMFGKPARATEIAKRAGLAFPSVMMHVIGLTRMGYASIPEKGLYVITANGKEVLGLPEVTNQKAGEILGYQPMEKSFHFYADVGKPLNIYATSLGDFCDKIVKVDPSSVEFHIARGDFEAWFNGLGDAELARKILLVREEKIVGEDLQRRFLEIVRNRCEELTALRNNRQV
jgi:hypothetical protein